MTFELTASDVDNDLLSYRIVEDPSHGRLNERENNQWTYTPFEEYFGEDTLPFRHLMVRYMEILAPQKSLFQKSMIPPLFNNRLSNSKKMEILQSS